MSSKFEDGRSLYRRKSQERIIRNTELRLLALHEFSGEIAVQRLGIPVSQVLEIGGDTGFQIPTIAKYASHITSIDIDPAKIQSQVSNAALQPLITGGELDVVQADARDMSWLGKFDMAIAHGIFGDGFNGDSIHDVIKVFDQIKAVLNPGGIMIASFMDERVAEMLSTFGIKTVHGFPVDIDDIKDHLSVNFKNIDLYGQLFWTLPAKERDILRSPRTTNPIAPAIEASRERLLHSVFFDTREIYAPSKEALKPRKIELYWVTVPTYWVVVCEK